MKQNLSETATFTQLMKVADEYFTQNFIDEIQAMVTPKMTDTEKMSFLWRRYSKLSHHFLLK